MNDAHDRFDVCIIGGGVIGACCALELAQTGQSVAILDRSTFGAACSHGNCGYVCPSHALPLARPGAIRQNALKSLFPSNALYIKPRLDPTLIAWLWRFMRRCNKRDMLAAASALHPLLESSRDLYTQIIETYGIDCDFEQGGLQYIYETEAAHDSFSKTADLLLERYGLVTERLDRDALVASEPALKPEAISGAWTFPRNAHLRPDKLMVALRRVLEAKGVVLLERRELSGMRHDGGAWTTAETTEGDLRADAFVVATGAMTPLLKKTLKLELNLPIQPGKGYSYTTKRPTYCPRLPMIFEEDHVAVTPWKSGYRVGSTMEFAGYDTTMNERRLANLKRASDKYLKPSAEAPVAERWFGWRPMTPDSLPMIGRVPGLKNVVLAAGHNMLGLSLATGTGRLVREILSDEPTHVPVEAFSPTRF